MYEHNIIQKIYNSLCIRKPILLLASLAQFIIQIINETR